MPSAWGEALMSLGSSLPKIGYSYDSYRENERQKQLEEEQRKKQELLFRQQLRNQQLQNEMSTRKIEEADYIVGERDKANQNFIQYVQDMRASKNIPEMAAAGPSPEHDRLVSLEGLGKMTPKEQLQEYDLIGGSQYSPKVNQYVSDVLDTEASKQKAAGQMALSNIGYQQDIEKMKTKSQLDSAEQRRQEEARLKLEREKMAGQKNLAEAKIANTQNNPEKLKFKNELIEQLKTVMNHPAKYSGISPGRVTSIFPTESRDFKQQIQKLKSMTTLENLKYLKGAMSDKDVKFIQEASTALDLGGSMNALDRELNKMYKSATSSYTPETPSYGDKAETRVVNGVTYRKVPGGWQRQ